MEFTQDHAVMLATMDTRLDNIITKLDQMQDKMDKCFNDHECRVRDIEIHGSQKVRDLGERVAVVETGIENVTKLVEYERGRLAVIFIAIGSLISAAISFWFTHT